MKNLRSLFAALMLLCSTMAFAEKVEIGGITYDLQKTLDFNEYRAKVVAGSSKYAGDIVIPAFVDYEGGRYDVTCIGSQAFYSCCNT